MGSVLPWETLHTKRREKRGKEPKERWICAQPLSWVHNNCAVRVGKQVHTSREYNFSLPFLSVLHSSTLAQIEQSINSNTVKFAPIVCTSSAQIVNWLDIVWRLWRNKVCVCMCVGEGGGARWPGGDLRLTNQRQICLSTTISCCKRFKNTNKS